MGGRADGGQLKKILIGVLFLIAGLNAALAQFSAGGSGANLLPPEKAFQFSARALDAGAIEVRFVIADGYYLYRERLGFSAEGNPGMRLGTPELPQGAKHRDEFFGDVQTYRKDVRIRVPVEGQGAFDLKVVSQGCADVGVCYVPMESRAHLVLASFLGFGLLLAFTPCMLPMIPILSGIIAGEGRAVSKMRALGLSVTYVLGMASAYAAAGVAAGYSGTLVAAALQNVWVLSAFALIFVALALSMFGFYDLALPHFLHHRLHSAHQRLQGGRIVSVAAMGILSAIIVSPCVAAPLAGALLYISQTRDITLGGSALFVMALGMGLPLIAVGVSEGALLPRSGPWMDGVRKFFGVLLLAVALWTISPALPGVLQMLAWAALAPGAFGLFVSGVITTGLGGVGIESLAVRAVPVRARLIPERTMEKRRSLFMADGVVAPPRLTGMRPPGSF